MSEGKKLDLSAVSDGIRPDTAKDVLEALLDGDMHLWMSLAVDFPHPPSALIDLVKKSGMKFPDGKNAPAEQELVLFLTGALPPSRRVVEIALFVANDPEALKQFEAVAKPIKADRSNLAFEGLAQAIGAKVNKTMQ